MSQKQKSFAFVAVLLFAAALSAVHLGTGIFIKSAHAGKGWGPWEPFTHGTSIKWLQEGTEWTWRHRNNTTSSLRLKVQFENHRGEKQVFWTGVMGTSTPSNESMPREYTKRASSVSIIETSAR